MALLPELVEIVPYDPVWPELFAREQCSLQQLFAGSNALIEHVGSTAVVGLGAKPIVDIMAGLPDIEVAEALLHRLQRAGYAYVPEFEAEIPDRRFLRKPAHGLQQFHLHCVPTDSDFFRQHILFRDLLRSCPATARDYLELKQSLAKRFPYDRPQYTSWKTEFIVQATARAEQKFSKHKSLNQG
jgi:GrpB-like predicted nucleotidyltransferase (UPF0157 family)